jgi:hypothetical protein
MRNEYEFTKELREALTKFDFEFFLAKNIKEENYPQEKIAELYKSKNVSIEKLKAELKVNKKQTLLYLNGEIAKAVRGGMLMSHFNLSENREFTIMDFENYGTDWAYFEVWKKYESQKLTTKKIWEWLTKVGAILAIVLSVIKLLEWFKIGAH